MSTNTILAAVAIASLILTGVAAIFSVLGGRAHRNSTRSRLEITRAWIGTRQETYAKVRLEFRNFGLSDATRIKVTLFRNEQLQTSRSAGRDRPCHRSR